MFVAIYVLVVNHIQEFISMFRVALPKTNLQVQIYAPQNRIQNSKKPTHHFTPFLSTLAYFEFKGVFQCSEKGTFCGEEKCQEGKRPDKKAGQPEKKL